MIFTTISCLKFSFFELVYIHNTSGFHCDNFLHVYSVHYTSIPPLPFQSLVGFFMLSSYERM
jgi:hypothetical protein